MLVVVLNLLTRKIHYLKQWLNLIKTSLEEGKEPVIGKLRNVKLVEADLQIGMRIALNSQKEELIETDNRFSKANYGSRRNYSITSALLQKRLTFDNSLISMKCTVHALTDLQSCYDRQLPNIGSIVEESAGRNRREMQLCAKIMLYFQNHVSTGCGVSEKYYGGENKLAGTGQGNKFSGDMCRDISCLIIRQLEVENLGICFLSLVTLITVLCASVSLVDDADLAADGENSVSQMQMMLKLCNKLHSATGGKTQVEKTKFFAWTWTWSQGKKKIKNVDANIQLNNQPMQ